MTHQALKLQLQELGIDSSMLPDLDAWQTFLDQVDRTYKEADKTLDQLEKSLAASSKQKQQVHDKFKHVSQVPYSSIFEGVQDAILMESPEGKILDVNTRACEIFGWDRDKLLTMSIYDLIPKDHIPEVKRMHINRELPETPMESISKRSNGDQFPVEVTARYHTIGDQEVVLAILRDITSRKQTEKALGESEEKFRNLAEKSPNMIFINQDGKIVYANAACEQIMGYTREEFYASDFDFLKLFAQETKKSIQRYFRMHTKGEEVPPYESTLITKDGRRLNTLHATRIVRYEGRNAILGIVTDVTDRKQKEEMLRQQAEDLNLLKTVNDLINYGESLKSIVRFLTKQAERSFSGFGTTMYLLSEDKDGLAAQNLSLPLPMIDQIKKLTGRDLNNLVLDPSPGSIYDQVLQSQEPQVLCGPDQIQRLLIEIAEDARLPGNKGRRFIKKIVPRIQQLLNIQAVIVIPLVSDREPIGLWVMARNYPFSNDDRNRMTAIAGQLTAAIKRRRGEEALRQSEANYRNIFDGVDDAILVVNMENEVVDANSSACEMFGWTKEQLLRKSISDLTPEDAVGISPSDLARDKKPERFLETISVRADGRSFPVEITARLQSIDDESVMLVVARDITERKQAEEEIRRSEERLRILFEYAPDGYYLSDLKGRFVDGNAAAEALVGYKKEELIGFNFFDIGLLKKKELPRATKLLARSVLGKSTGPDEFELIRKDGSTVSVEITTYPVMIDDRTLVLGIARDITERIKAEAAIRRSEDRFRSVAETAVDAVVLTDSHGAIRYWNKAAENVFHYESHKIIGKPLFMLMAEKHRAKYADELLRPDKLEESKVLGSTVEIRGLRKDGIEFPMQISISSWEAEGERFFSAIIRDITKEREAQTLAQLQDRLAAVGQLAAGIAHDFNNIIGTIILYSELMLNSQIRLPEDRDRLTTIFNQAQRGATLVSQILDFSRRSVLERHPMDLVPFLREIGRLLDRTLPEYVHLSFNFNGEDRYIVNADPTHMQQVIMNLALNARDAMPEGGDLTFEVSKLEVKPRNPPYRDMKPGPWVRLKVMDNGCGIPQDDLPHIFEPFFTTKPQGEGTGLGLPQVYGIVKQHDGYIDVETKVSEGTTFTIYLPALLERSSPMVEMSVIDSKKGSGETVLVVEDDEATRTALCEILDSLGYQTIQVSDGKQAIQVLEKQSQSINLVVSDLVMPKMGGRELYEKISDTYPGMKMILITGYPLGTSTRELIDRKRVTWMQKPFTSESLAQTVRNTLVSVKE